MPSSLDELTGTQPADEVPEGPYPIVTRKQPGGGTALVVQAYAFGKYLGFLRVAFDANGAVTNWTGNPILLDDTIEQGELRH